MMIATAFLVATLSLAPAEGAVLDVVQRFFDTLSEKDVETARELLLTDGQFVSIRTVDGKRVVRTSSAQGFLDGIATSEGEWLERMWEPEVRVRGDLATVLTPYDFHVDGVFSHCGVDALDLIRIDGSWKITAVTYTVERKDCAPSPLGPPK
jgi:hypothetical protein